MHIIICQKEINIFPFWLGQDYFVSCYIALSHRQLWKWSVYRKHYTVNYIKTSRDVKNSFAKRNIIRACVSRFIRFYCIKFTNFLRAPACTPGRQVCSCNRQSAVRLSIGVQMALQWRTLESINGRNFSHNKKRSKLSQVHLITPETSSIPSSF